MKKIDREAVLRVYDDMKAKINTNISSGNSIEALRQISQSARWAYNFNFIYTDIQIENDLRTIADKHLKHIKIDTLVKNRYVFFDTAGLDNRGLTQQYLRALMTLGHEFLYIYIEDNIKNIPEILREIDEYPKGEHLLFNNQTLNELQKSRCIIDKLVAYKPEKILLHLMPWDVVSLMSIYCIKGPVTYNINLTDHAYWMGASFVNYNIEFRPYGKTVSLERRNLSIEQLLYLPYYPIRSKYTPFKGFPELPHGSVIVFSGGAFYKMFGENDAYFKMVDAILGLSPNVVLLLAGGGDEVLMKKKIEAMNHGDRVYLIGNRKDIDEVFKHCDIYLGTYPSAGGLMSQYAAMHAKPIIAYYNPQRTGTRVEGIVNHRGKGVSSFSDMPELLSYASLLIKNKDFRIKEGIRAKEALTTEELFVTEFSKLMESRKNTVTWENEDVDYEAMENRYLDIENNCGYASLRGLVANNRFSFWYKYPDLLPLTFPIFCVLVKNKLKRLVYK